MEEERGIIFIFMESNRILVFLCRAINNFFYCFLLKMLYNFNLRNIFLYNFFFPSTYHFPFPFALKVGFYDGGIAVYNVRKPVDEPVLDNL